MTTRTPRPLAEQFWGLRQLASRQNALMEQARKGNICPECGETQAIQDNGERGIAHTFRCETCNNQWDTTIGKDG